MISSVPKWNQNGCILRLLLGQMEMLANKFLQSDKVILSRFLLAQQARQYAIVAEEKRYA